MHRTLKFVGLLSIAMGFAGPANAHLVIENFKGRAGYNEFLSLMVPHGCGNLATTEIRMKIPESVVLFSPEQKGGWETELVMRKLDEPVKRPNGTVISEVYDQVIWRGSLSANQLGVFKFLAKMPNQVGAIVPFKTIQTCGDTQDRWVDVVEEGEPSWKMWASPTPAPFVEVVEAGGPQLGATSEMLRAERAKRGGASGPK